MIKKILLFCFVVAFIACSDNRNDEAMKSDNHSNNAKIDRCNDGAIQYDILTARSNIKTDDNEINLTDVYCANDTVTYVYTINLPDEISTIKAQKAEFDEVAKNEIKEFFCDDKWIELYSIKERNMSIKWQYIFKGEKEIFAEFTANKESCR